MGRELTGVPSRDFYDRPVLVVARDLLGTTVRHGPVALRVTEVEAYGGTDDPASHAFRGPTPRSRVMFGPPGHAYVYFVYGMHWCFNVVCGPEGTAAAVLVRAGAVVRSVPAEQTRAAWRVASGPGRFARVLGVDGGFTGTDLAGSGPVTVHTGVPVAEAQVGRGPRIGIRVGLDLAYRLWVLDEPSVSRVRPPRPRLD
ncbi:DNA-3-methyladenine glycosylase [Parafrankia discariae]|uniref:DNA-3-methyladenine glycosylase n=1 Tax=Parafrankia discariae TaxID=365528 RepID=UPI00037EF707|nr:DNA-3-methyladenine glycosylase [Parafrankia discariae]